MSSTAIPRYRSFEGPALFRQGFRPFFLGGALWTLLAMVLWVHAFVGALHVPSAFGPVAWHAHEMIFGYAVAVVAGFLLTAIPNWTGRMPLQGWPLAGLVALWTAGRIACGFSDTFGAGAAAVVDLAFLAVFLAVVAREILAGRNWRNLPMLAALTVLLAANALTHVEALGWAESGALGQRLGVAVLVLLISLIGGRIVPSFTRNWLKKRDETDMPAAFGRFDRFALAVTLGALLAWVAWPASPLAGFLLLAAGASGVWRLARWRGQRTLEEPLVWSLHLGYAWVPFGLLLMGATALGSAIPQSAGVHALTVGAIGGMTLAVMTRATLGHTGRALSADRWTSAIYVAVFLAAATRVAASFLDAATVSLLWASAALWCAAFGLFLGRFGPWLARA